MRVQLIDPSGDVLPYDHALAGALARRRVDVELVTSRFVHGPAPAPESYEVSESFYRLATSLGAHLEQRHRRRVVDPDRRVAQNSGGASEAHELLVVELSLAQSLRIDATL